MADLHLLEHGRALRGERRRDAERDGERERRGGRGGATVHRRPRQ